MSRLVEDGAEPGLALAPELVEDLRPRDGYEVGSALVRHRPRQERLAGPGRAVEEDALVWPDVELPEDLRVGYGEFYRLAHPAHVLVARGRHVAAARGHPTRRRDPGPAAAHAARQALDQAFPLLLRRDLLVSVARPDDLPTGERTVLPVAPVRLSSRVYLLGEA